jgi:hypothetical protein
MERARVKLDSQIFITHTKDAAHLYSKFKGANLCIQMVSPISFASTDDHGNANARVSH